MELKGNFVMLEASGITYYVFRGLWTSSGVCALTLGAVGTNDFTAKLVLILTGLLTTLMSLLFGSFIKHLTTHTQDRNLIFADLEKKHTKLLKQIEKVQSKERCAEVHGVLWERMELHFKDIDGKLVKLANEEEVKEAS